MVNIENKNFFCEFINEVANRFEIDRKVYISKGARLALLNPALSHQYDIRESLIGGEITIEYLERCIIDILMNVYLEDDSTYPSTLPGEAYGREFSQKSAFPQSKTIISGEDIGSSMNIYCPYIFRDEP